MDKRPLNIVRTFLSSRLKAGGKLLLALSGGPDSLALFYLLLDSRPLLDFKLHIAHIDHGWRKESKEEGATLEALAHSHTLPFHLKTLQHIPTKNRENWCRDERLKFFSTLHTQHQFQGILLAHHGDDQGETILKRICEGASLRGLGGLREERTLGDLPIWRPLLFLRKIELEDYLNHKNLHPFRDETNEDPTYLRARMRQQIFPHLEARFGKQIGRNFIEFGSLFQEVWEYFEQKVKMFEPYLTRGPFGDHLNLDSPFYPIELKCFLQKYAREYGASLTREHRHLLMRFIMQKEPSRRIKVSPLTFVVNRSHLFIVTKPFPNFSQNQSQWQAQGQAQEQDQGQDQGKGQGKGQGKVVKKTTWLNFWKGEISYPKGWERIIGLDQLDTPLKKKLQKWYASHHIPPFLQRVAPVFMKGDQLLGECLTGKSLRKALTKLCPRER